MPLDLGRIQGICFDVDGTLTDVSNTPYVFIEDQDRDVWYASLQDQWQIANDWNLTAGVREDVHVGVPRAGRWRVRLNSDWEGYDPALASVPTLDAESTAEARDSMGAAISIAMGPYSVVILSQGR